MTQDHRALAALRREFSDWRLWLTRVVLIAMAAVAGLTVVAFTWLGEQAFHGFGRVQAWGWWAPLVWMPLCTAAIAWATRRFAPGAAGSGIPQVMASLEAAVEPAQRRLFVSLRLSIAKFFLTALGLLAGLSLGREGPSVQIAAGVMHWARRLLPAGSAVTPQGLLVAGGAAGIAAAFNTPLAGVVFAIEELSRRPEQRSSGLIVAGIVISGLMAVSVYGNATYFGVIHVPQVGWSLLLPGLLVALASGVAGGLFARLLLASLAGAGRDALSSLRRRQPVVFAALCGGLVALIGVVTQGATYGSGYAQTRHLIDTNEGLGPAYVLFKFIATWLTTWSGVPAGIFAPSLAIGAALGHDVALLLHYPQAATLIALGMAGFLAAATQAPLTAFIIVMEMVDGHAMVLSLMATALIASGVSRLLGRPLYGQLAQLQLKRLPPATAAARPPEQPG
jgi:H+/Cl- antiporter ClcA